MTINAPTEDIKDFLLVDEPLGAGGLVFGTNLFIFLEPATPDTVFTLMDTGGYDRESGSDYQKPTILVRARGDQGAYVQTYTNLKKIADYLQSSFSGEILNREINSCRYIAIWQEGDIIPLGLDENSRPILTANFRIHRTAVV